MNITKPVAAAIALLAICLTAHTAPARTSNLVIPKPASGQNPPVVLKVDDLVSTRDGRVPERWQRITDFAKERKIKLSIGIIANSLEGDKPAYFDYIKTLRSAPGGQFEFWFHGYDHREWAEDGKKLQEFRGTSYEHQKDHFEKSQKLAREKLGFAFETFGAPFNATDRNTDRVLAEDPDMKIFLYGGPSNRGSGKLLLERIGEANIENPIFVPNPDALAAAYHKYSSRRAFFVLQGHPNQWDDTRWAAFVKLVDFLQQNDIPIVTAADLAAIAVPGPAAPAASASAGAGNANAPLFSWDFNKGAGVNVESNGSADEATLTLVDHGGKAASHFSDNKQGVSGREGDYALDLTSATGMGATQPNSTGPVGVVWSNAAGLRSLGNLASFTLTGWLKPSVALDRSARIIVSDTIALMAGSANQLALQVVGNGDRQTARSQATYTEVGNWMFFAVTYDGTQSADNVKFYIGTPASGALAEAGTETITAGPTKPFGGQLLLGNNSTAGDTTRPFQGLMDDIAIYGTTSGASGALSPEQLTRIFRASLP
ncbi:putative xylanase/chitin deacetylase [Opitutaceae bacterium TAV1]|nr:putative xylanase/chitin deacetylase [Opitutaceae bacterium TAV1]